MPTALHVVDASAGAGGGHLARSGAIADELADRGWDCILVADTGTRDSRDAPVPSWCADSYAHVEVGPLAEADLGPTDLLAVDHYGLDGRFESRQNAGLVLVVDDLADRRHECDVLVDSGLDRSADDYRGLVPDDATILVGPSVAPLRRQFRLAREELLASAVADDERILLSFGAVDSRGMTSLALASLEDVGWTGRVDVLLGEHAPGLDQVQHDADGLGFPVTLHVAISEVGQLMARSGLAIGAAGVGALERCVVGLPSVIVAVAENQLPNAFALERAGAALVVRAEHAGHIERLSSALRRLLHDRERLRLMGECARSLCDGLGARRIADAIDGAVGERRGSARQVTRRPEA